MNRFRHLRACIGAVVIVTAFAGCGEKSGVAGDSGSQTTLEKSSVEGVMKITLSAAGQKRIDLKTTPTKATAEGLSIPYSAVIYDPDGASWAYVGDATVRTYQRKLVVVKDIEGDIAVLSSGLAEGTEVVTRGAAQLYGAERGMGR